MKKIYLFTLLTFFGLSLVAQTHWQKGSFNPVLSPGPSGEWDDEAVQPGSVLYLDSMYHMWYWTAGEGIGGQVGYASSPDGLTWTKHEENPVLEAGAAGGWDESGVFCGDVLFEKDLFHMWYQGNKGPTNTQDINIGHATSPDGINWTKDAQNPVLKVGPDKSWDDLWVSLGSVVYDGTGYQMWYEGYGGSGDNRVRVGHATSPDGVNWTKNPQNPVFWAEDEAWDAPRVDDPNVHYDGNSFQMWYLGGEFRSGEIGYATSDDGVNWTVAKNNPVLKKGPEGSWDESSLGWHSVLDSAGIKYKMWFGGGDDPNSSTYIGYAESDTRVPLIHMTSAYMRDPSMSADVGINVDGTIYMVPLGTSLEADSIKKHSLVSKEAMANQMLSIPLTLVPVGQYLLVAISVDECVCYRGTAMRVVDDLTPPELVLEKESVVAGENIVASSSKDGVLFLVENISPANILYLRSRRFLIDSAVVTANVAAEFESVGLEGDVKLFALDKYAQLSGPKTVQVIGVGINNSESDASWVQIYPNPVDKLLMIELQKEGVYAIKITSLIGHKVLSLPWKGGSGEIDLSTMDPGVYFIQVDSEERSWTGKLVKLK